MVSQAVRSGEGGARRHLLQGQEGGDQKGEVGGRSLGAVSHVYSLLLINVKTRLRFEVFSLEQAFDTFPKKLAQLLNQA